ncbi:MAG: EamA family transporter RarD [Sphaerochaetaceae bacterium]|nr:EamA family transporter RarD [Sphaerochaetaceae bacterium]
MNGRTNGAGRALALIVTGYLIWGLLPLYWKLLSAVPSLEVLVHRILWSAVLSSSYFLLRGINPLKVLREIFRLHSPVLLLTSALILALNWLSYVYAITSGHLLQASMGYFIAPMLTVFFGLLFFRERMNRLQAGAVILSGLGVLFTTLQAGKVPYLSLFIALTFSLYTMCKKKIHLDGLKSLLADSLILLPAVLVYLAVLDVQGSSSFTLSDPLTGALLIASGFATMIPLTLYINGAIRFEMKSVGFLQFITPVMAFLLGVFVYRETLLVTDILTFSFILAGAGLYIRSVVSPHRLASDH